MESELSANEEEYFEITRRISTADYINHTPDTLSAGVANEVIRINNARDSVLNTVGAGIMLKVYPGDTIRSKAFAKYADFDNSNTNLVSGLAGYLGSVFGLPVVGEGGLPIFDVVEQPWFLMHDAWNDLDEDQPRAYLNFLLFDNNFSFQDFGFDQVSTAAKITGDSLAHQHEELNLEVVVKKDGFIYLYVTNENDQDMEIYFDDFVVDHIYGDIVAGGDYYPFGLPLTGRTIQKKGYRHDYQGEFAEKDKETGWNSFELRMYDPVIGRWISSDPYAQFWSPYLGMGNNPINGIDPDGGFLNPIVGSDGKFRGFDDQGPGGEAIVYDGDFVDEMSQAAILDNGGTFFSEFASLSGMTSMEYQTFRTIYLKTFERYLETTALVATGELIRDISLGLSFMTGGGIGNVSVNRGLMARGVGNQILTASPRLFRATEATSGSVVNKIAQSMRQNGWQGEAIHVYKLKDGTFVILNGHHRVQAAAKAGVDVHYKVLEFTEARSLYGWQSEAEIIMSIIR